MATELLKLAAWTAICPECGGAGHHWVSGEVIRCEPCKGTGRVARFPGLREACPVPAKVGSGYCPTRRTTVNDTEPCEVCNGRGWRPVSEERALAAVLEAIRSQGWYFSLNGNESSVGMLIGIGTGAIGYGSDPSPLAAAARALLRAAWEEA